MNQDLGVCYYPEHWPPDRWPEDARRMVEAGIRWVRIAEFAWSRIEPSPGRFDWDWLDAAIATLGEAGLSVVMCTPTATPPKWLIDAFPDILAVDRQGRPRRFGSRRHSCFSSPTWLREAARITEAVAARYGKHRHVGAWQTDNEYGCHDTTRSYSEHAAVAFRAWLARRHGSTGALNTAWGTVFWSQEYRSFSEVDLPHLTVTEPNPAHVLDFYRFSSDQVVAFNRMQCGLLRRHAPERPLIHNFMGFTTDFDHFAVAADLDAASWDSYPLGFLDNGPFSEAERSTYLRQGHPDMAAFHHDLYRSVGRGRWWVMEQQPGPVNWADHNPAPLPGMVRLWSFEALAHGAETVSYFRWRQVPFAQEQNHAGLLRPDGEDAAAMPEVHRVRDERRSTGGGPAQVALVFSYEAAWSFETQPQGKSWDYWRLVLDWYGCARQLAMSLDVVAPDADLSGYALVLIPSLPILPPSLLDALSTPSAAVVVGPRTGSRTAEFHIPAELPPGPLQALLPLKVTSSESLPVHLRIPARFADQSVAGQWWLDHVETSLMPVVADEQGRGLLYRHEAVHAFTTVPEPTFLTAVLEAICEARGLPTTPLPEGLRVRRCGSAMYAFN
ncbi:MAG TPA: beta-galactosidase, partial [Deltaproteobacteria bacterium]|nr:beta-galactosidase [Deltaproteobacteria bacterium]